jgi:choline dehydrogenase-like flavoprotein
VVLERLRAVGVEIHRHGEKHTIRAEREVVLSAGAYNSPQILMLSGIGKSADLKAVGIKPHADLPVGDDLQDHPGILLSYFTDSSTLFRAGAAEDVQHTRRISRAVTEEAETVGTLQRSMPTDQPSCAIKQPACGLSDRFVRISGHHAFDERGGFRRIAKDGADCIPQEFRQLDAMVRGGATACAL